MAMTLCGYFVSRPTKFNVDRCSKIVRKRSEDLGEAVHDLLAGEMSFESADDPKLAAFWKLYDRDTVGAAALSEYLGCGSTPLAWRDFFNYVASDLASHASVSAFWNDPIREDSMVVIDGKRLLVFAGDRTFGDPPDGPAYRAVEKTIEWRLFEPLGVSLLNHCWKPKDNEQV